MQMTIKRLATTRRIAHDVRLERVQFRGQVLAPTQIGEHPAERGAGSLLVDDPCERSDLTFARIGRARWHHHGLSAVV